MNYIFKIGVGEKEYTKFIKISNSVSFMQEYGWGIVKEDWKREYCALYKDNNIVAVALLLIRKFPMNKTLIYSPRGFVTDFSNLEVITKFTEEIKKYAKSKNAFAVKIDPNFCVAEKNIQDIEKNINTDIPIFSKNNYEMNHNNLINAGWVLKKRSLDMTKTNQPRFQMAIPLIDNNDNFLDENEVKNSFKKRIREYLGNYHTKRGVFFEHTNDLSKIDEFMEIINLTEERQNIVLRNKEYFTNIMKEFDAYLFFGKLDLDIYSEFLSKNSNLKELEKIENLKEKGNKIINLSASLVIVPKSEKQMRNCEYLYAGNNLEFSKLNVSYGLVYDICKFALEKKCHFVNLGGVNGTLDDHLTIFKSRFNSIVWEYTGEYDLIIHPLYYPIEKFLPLAKKIYRKIKR